MNWLTRVDISVEAAMGDKLYDRYDWHQKIWKCFPLRDKQNRIEVGFLTRLEAQEGSYRLWILSKEEPSCPSMSWAETFEIKKIPPSFLSHDRYAFDVIANPTRTRPATIEGKPILRFGPDGSPLLKQNGKPKQVHGKREPIVGGDNLREWLLRKGAGGGFQIPNVSELQILQLSVNRFQKVGNKDGVVHVGTHSGVQFRGVLEVTDRQKFIETYQSGIGSAKGFGFGMLLIAPLTN